jgi:hypothetical protein
MWGSPRGEDREHERDAQEKPGGPGGKNASGHFSSKIQQSFFEALYTTPRGGFRPRVPAGSL